MLLTRESRPRAMPSLGLWFSRLVHAIRTWDEDRRVPEASTVEQWKKLWAKEPRTVLRFRNLTVYRAQRKTEQVA